MKLFVQSLTLSIATLLVLLITSTPADAYMAPILGVVIAFSVIYVIIKRKTKKEEELFVGSNLEVFAVTVVLLLAVFLTGGLTSNLFFLLYFLLFGIVFLFEPPTVFVLLAGLLIVFFTSIGNGDLPSNLIKLGSLVFLSPISYFFGREFQKREKLEEKVEDKTGQIIEDAQTLLEHTQNEEAKDEIEDIIEMSNQLRQENDK